MKSRSQNWESAVVTLVVAVTLVALLIRLGPTQPRAEPQERKRANEELNDLFVGEVRNPDKRDGSTTTPSNKLFYDNSAPAQAVASRKGWVRLPGEVPSALARAKRLPGTIPASNRLILTLVLNRADQPGFESFLRNVQDPQSASYGHYLSQHEQAERFGPSPEAYKAVLDWIRRKKFAPLQGSANRLTITIGGTRAQIEAAFGVHLDNYRIENRTFYANGSDPVLPATIASQVQAVVGLSNFAQPVRAHSTYAAADLIRRLKKDGGDSSLASTCWLVLDRTPEAKEAFKKFLEAVLGEGYTPGAVDIFSTVLRYLCAADELDLINQYVASLGAPASELTHRAASRDPKYAFAQLTGAAPPLPGTGQKIGLLEFDNFHPSDVQDFLNLINRGSQFAKLSQVHVSTGAGSPGQDESEVLLDIDAVMSLAPGAQVIVYDGPFNGRGSFQTMLNAMTNDGVNVISNSWAYCEDQTNAADVQSIDSILASAAAAGITVISGSGDHGSTCLNGSLNTVHVPASSPHITTVGGATPIRNIAGTYGSETWWNSATDLVPGGQGGFGLSRFFPRPSYQSGLTTSSSRSIPDVTAPADPAMGYFICQADAGGCPTNLLYGGTSVAAPIWAAFVAVLNQQQNRSLGFLNPLLYPLANTSAFHSAAEMGSDFSHVGLGSPNVGALNLVLSGGTPGPVSADDSFVGAFPPIAFADGTSQVGVAVATMDANLNSVSGQTVQLTMNSGSHAVITTLNSVTNVSNGVALFTVTDTTLETVTFTATVNGVMLTQHPSVQFVSLPATAGGISASPTTVTANGADATMITVTLQDAKGNPSPGKVINLSQGNGASILSATTAITDATGRVQFTAVDNKAETVTYIAVDVTDGNLPVPGSAAVNFVNASGFCAGLGTYNFGITVPGLSVRTFASNFPNDCFAGIGPIGLVFDATGNLLVADNGTLYRFGSQGGTAGPATQVGIMQAGAGPGGLAFTKDGRLYAAFQAVGTVVEVDPATGAIVRTVVNLNGPVALAVDPISGDLFVSNFNGVQRISNFATGPGTLTPYFSSFFTDGIVFAPDGTLYVAANAIIWRVSGTNAAQPGTTKSLTHLASSDGLALELNPADASKPFIYVNRNDGIITRIDTSTLPANGDDPCGGACTDIYTGGSRGDFLTVSPFGCLFATQSDRVIQITKADGTCSLTPTNPAAQIVLTAQTISPSPAQGTSVTFAATVKNAASPANIPVTLIVGGANSDLHLVRTDANGKASFTYTGVLTGTDRLIAFADIGGSLVISNSVAFNWTDGKHSTFLSLNTSPDGGAPNRSLTFTTTLVDTSTSPPVVVCGAVVSFSLAGQTCTGTTDASGTATCSITPNVAAASYPLVATFGGSSSLLSSSANKTVDLIDAPAIITPNVQFSASTYTVNEGCAAGMITVTRTGDTTGTATVDFSTNDASAQQRTDYSIGSGTLTFAPGETSKTFAVLVSKDAYAEGNEALTVTLGNWTGTALGTPNIATVTIIDDTAVPTNSQPIDDASTFVCQHYHDFLARESDSGGAAFWTSQITQCGNDANCIHNKRIDVSNAFFYELEYQQTGAYVFRLYRAAFGNNQPLANPDNSNVMEAKKLPSYAAFSRDRARVVGGANLAQGQLDLANAFVQRPEFLSKYPGSLDGPGFVDAVLNTINNDLGIDLTAQRASLINLFNSSGRGGVMYRLADDNASGNPINNRAFIDEEYNRAFVATQYFGYLRRDSDIGGFLFWLGQVNSGPLRDVAKQHAMVCSFVTADEYQQRFSSVVTHSNVECPH